MGDKKIFDIWIMGRLIKNNLGNFLMIFIIVILVSGGAFYYFSVITKGEGSQEIKILPIAYQGTWNNQEASFIQDLGPKSGFEEFNEENSAYPFARQLSQEELIVSEPEVPVEEEVATLSEEMIATSSEDFFEETPVSPSEGAQLPYVLGILLDLIATESEETVEQLSSESIVGEIVTQSEELIGDEVIEMISTESEPIIEEVIDVVATESGESVSEVEPLIIDFAPGFVESVLEFSDFDVPAEFIASGSSVDKEIKNVQMRMSLAFENGGPQDSLVIEYTYDTVWDYLAEYFLSDSNSNATNNDYWLYALPIFENWEDLSKLKIRFRYRGMLPDSMVPIGQGNQPQGSVYLDALWLEVEHGSVEAPFIAEIMEGREDAEIELISDKKDFKLDEEPEFEFKYKRKRNVLVEFINLFRDEYKDIKIKVQIFGPNGKEIDYDDPEGFSPQIEYQKEGEFLVALSKPRHKYYFKPGKYKLRFEIEDEEELFIQEQEFTWGVLAINVNKSIYLPNEQSYLQMAVLRDDGHTICDANLKLEIKKPGGSGLLGLGKPKVTVLSTENGLIEYSGECGPNNVIDVPDYFAYYEIPSKTGVYETKLTNLDNSYEITDSFEVRESVLFDVERIGPTRIYPPATYEMVIKIKANQDFKGDIVETVPMLFAVTEATLNPAILAIQYPNIGNYTKTLTWEEVDFKAGESYEIRYVFDAPDVSPYLYLMGPLKFYGELGEMVSEDELENEPVYFPSDAPVTGSFVPFVPIEEIEEVATESQEEVIEEEIVEEPAIEEEIATESEAPTPEGVGVPTSDDDQSVGKLPASPSEETSKLPFILGVVLEVSEFFKAKESIASENKEKVLVFEEARKWQIASDLSEGPHYPSTQATSNAESPWVDLLWTTPENIASSEGSYANTGTKNDIYYTYQLLATEYNFNLPSNATIEGIEVGWEGYADVSLVTHDLVQIVDETGTMVGENKASSNPSLPLTEQTVTFGDSSDGWDITGSLSYSDINDPDFGVTYACHAPGQNQECWVDTILVTVYYREPAFTNISGSCRNYDDSGNCPDCTNCVKVSVAGAAPESQVGSITGGSWSITEVSQPSDTDILTVFLDGARADVNESVAVMEYDGAGDISGVQLFDQHLTVANGGNTNFNISNADLGTYDNSVSTNENIFHDVDVSNNLEACNRAGAQGCEADVRLYITEGMTYQPGGNIDELQDMDIEGTFNLDSYIASLSGSWENGGDFDVTTGDVFLTASSSVGEIVSSSGCTGTCYFDDLKFGDDSGTAEWDLQSALDVNGNLEIDAGTLDVNTSNYVINIGVNFTAETNASLSARSGTITLDGTTSTTFIDSTTNKIEPYNLTINKSGTDSNDNLVLSSNLSVRNTITLTDGQIIQGNYNVRAEGSAAVSIASGVDKEWTNIGTGDLTLGGTFDNAGSVSFDTNDNNCNSDISDDIQILSTSAGIQRNWTGSGTFYMYNIYVQDMTSAPPIIVRAGSYSNVGDNWSFQSCKSPPTINEVNVYGTGVTEVTITEDSVFDIMASAYIDDADGCTSVRDEGGVEAIFYTANQYWTPGQTGTCSLDYNNCIDNSVTSCSYQACNGNIATYECWASSSWYYYADATIGSTASVSGGWEVVVWASDSLSTVESSSCDDFAPTASNQAEVTLVSAITLETGSQSVAYSNTTDNTDSAIAERGMRNSGNRGINPQIQQTTALTSSGNTISAQSQLFASGSFSFPWDSDAYGVSLSESYQELDLDLPQRTDDDDEVDDQIFWGLHVPLNTFPGNYAGENTYTAVPD